MNTITLVRKNWQGEAFLGILTAANFHPTACEETYLHEQELAYYRRIQYEKRRHSYLAGRYIAKQALGHFLNTALLNEILIFPGVFDQPIVTAATFNPPAVSISHTEDTAACVVFPREHPMGLDAETVQAHKAEAIESQLTAHEKCLCRAQKVDKVLMYTHLWTAKEALAKLLTTGLMVPMEIYQVETLNFHDKFVVSTFTNFEQYQAVSFWQNNTIFSLALPKNTQYSFT